MTANIIEDSTFRERTFVFRDRLQAGTFLAKKLLEYAGKKNVILLALPSGGVPVGYSAAKTLRISMDLMVVRKVQIPWNTEAGFGAVTWDGETVLNQPFLNQLGLRREVIEQSISKTRKIIQERLEKFRNDKPMPNLRGKVVILVDDGLASGFTMLAAARSARKDQPIKTVVAVPTGSIGAIRLLAPEVDEIVCLNIRSGPVFAVADAYKNWYDLTDGEVINIIKKAHNFTLAP